jgi:hypothetical protein
VGLARGSLTVGEDGAVETFDYAVDDRRRGVGVDFLLAGLDVEHLVEAELYGILIVPTFPIFHLHGLVVEQLVAVGGSQCFLPFVEGSEATDDFDIRGCSAAFLLRCHDYLN